MPGAGINAHNRSMFAQAGFKAIHASASALITEELPATNVSFEEQRKKGQRREINPEYLKNLLHPGWKWLFYQRCVSVFSFWGHFISQPIRVLELGGDLR